MPDFPLQEEIMNKRSMRPIGIAALALGATLVSATAFAQMPARNSNDGGPVPNVPGARTAPVAPPAPFVGRSPNDGGPVMVSGGTLYNNTSAPSAPVRPGRNANDGGTPY
jgi:hypothetical protein